MLALRGCDVNPVHGELITCRSANCWRPPERRTSSTHSSRCLRLRMQAAIISSDPDDIGHLLSCLGVRRPVLQA